MAVRRMRMIDMYSLQSARQLTAGQQMTIIDHGVGQFYTLWCSLSGRVFSVYSACLCRARHTRCGGKKCPLRFFCSFHNNCLEFLSKTLPPYLV